MLSDQTNLQVGESAPSRTAGGKKSVWTWWKISHTEGEKKGVTCCLMLVKPVLTVQGGQAVQGSVHSSCWLGAGWAGCWLGAAWVRPLFRGLEYSTGVQTGLARTRDVARQAGGRLQHQLGKATSQGKNQVPCLTQHREGTGHSNLHRLRWSHDSA